MHSHPVCIYVMEPIGVPGALVDQVKLVFVGHAYHVVVFPRRTVHQRHHHGQITKTDLLRRVGVGGNTHEQYYNFSRESKFTVSVMLLGIPTCAKTPLNNTE